MIGWKNWFVEHREGAKYCYLVNDVTFRRKRTRIRHRIEILPDSDLSADILFKSNLKLLINKYVIARAKLISDYYTPQYISVEEVIIIEQAATLATITNDLLPLHEKKVYQERFNVEYIHGTTSIEGNTLSNQQISDLFEYGLLPKNKTSREVFEVKNFEAVLKYRSKYKGKITLRFIKTLHELITSNTDDDAPGVFRQHDRTIILGYDYPVCPSVLIEEELHRIIAEYYDGVSQNKHPFELAVLFHRNFEVIHPFSDGNGRVGREIFNYMITRAGYPPMLFLGKEREEYISALCAGNEGEYKRMVEIFVRIYITLYQSLISGG